MTDKSKDADLPRFTKLDAFNPHRPSFECKHEADANPPITPEAEGIYQQAQTATSYELWPEQRNYAKAATLYEQAMKLGHWKAQFNLAGLYYRGLGVPQDTEKAIELTEDLMKKGVPAAWDNMGAYVMGGAGNIKQDATAAYAFWQKAADMGSMSAQTFLGEKLLGSHDEPPSFWGNRSIGLKMLECAFAQGSGKAASELGLTVGNTDHEYDRALRVLHEGVKLGSEDSANYLFSSFDAGDPLVKNTKDRARAERYGALGNALYRNPDLRFPNLDKVLPLPPARLPMWDGNDESLINAAKAVVAKPAVPVPPKPASGPASVPPSQRTGRAHIPEGFALPERPQVEVPPQYESTRAPVSGYWIARLVRHSEERHVAWDEAQWPVRYDRDELFDLDASRIGLHDGDGRILFHYLGDPVPVQAGSDLTEHPLVARGIARYADQPEPPKLCKGHAACPETGIWSATVAKDHSHAAVFNQWSRQAYVAEGEAFPDPKQVHLDIEPGAVTWRWWGQSNDIRNVFLSYIRVDEPKEADEAPAPDPEVQVQAAPAAATPASEEAPARGKGLLGSRWPWRG